MLVFLKRRSFIQIHLTAIAAVVLVSCASPKPLSGGPKDVAPPVILEAESTPNKQINFKEKEIVLTFDEWVVLKDVYVQWVVSPLMPKEPEIKQKGKSIIITLPDSLRAETTYSIHFGNAITDLNEGNILENYSFIFSTGSFLDSVRLSGTVSDAVTLKPLEHIWVMLHPAGRDSAAYKEKPSYLAKTNKEGKWSISNIRTDRFVVVALKDENINLLYDQESEAFGWYDAIVVTDTSAVIPDIRLFPKERKQVIVEANHVVPGWLKLFNPGSVPKAIPLFEPPIDPATYTWDVDTLQIWYSPDANYSGRAILGSDTTRIRVSAGTSLLQSKMIVQTLTGRLHPVESAQFKSQIPLVAIDTSRIQISNDSLGRMPFTAMPDTLDHRYFSLLAAWKPLFRYTVIMLPGALKDVWGRMNDTLKYSLVVSGADQYGIFHMEVEGMDSLQQYIVLLKTGDKTLATFILKNQSTASLTSKPMLPGKFTIEMIHDRNGNGLWDTGDYHVKRQPEVKKIFTPDPLRAGWDVEFKVPWTTGGL